MAAIVEDERLDRRGRALFDRAHLGERAVLIVRPLDDEGGRAPALDDAFDGPGLEAGIEPGAVPAEESGVDMGVMAGEPGLEVARLVGALRLGDGGKPRRAR